MELVHDIIKGKWKWVILWHLGYNQKSSLSQLERGIKGINQKMLIEQLKELIEFDLVNKKKYEGYPLKVEYSLTKNKGIELLKALKIMQKLGQEYIDKDKCDR